MKGKIVTIDAGGATTTIVNKIVDCGADCIIGLKGNQPASKKLTEKLLERQEFKDSNKAIFTKNKGHGRQETREYKLINMGSLNTSGLEKEIKKFKKKWPDIASIGVANMNVITYAKNKSTIRFFLTTLTNLNEFAEATRIHWQIESRLHWVLDVVLREDHCRTRNGNSASNLSLIRKIALNLLTINSNQKNGTRLKQIKCSNDKNFLMKILGGFKTIN